MIQTKIPSYKMQGPVFPHCRVNIVRELMKQFCEFPDSLLVSLVTPSLCRDMMVILLISVDQDGEQACDAPGLEAAHALEELGDRLGVGSVGIDGADDGLASGEMVVKLYL